MEKVEKYLGIKDIEEICVTLLIYDSSYLYHALGMALVSEKIGELMNSIETISHREKERSNTKDYFIKIGKIAIKNIISEIVNYKKSLGNPRNEVKFNYKKIKEYCTKVGYKSESLPFLINAMMIRRL